MFSKLTLLFMFCLLQAEACKHVHDPVVKQVSEDLVIVEWVHTAFDHFNVKAFIIKYWKKNSPQDETPIPIYDLSTNFVHIEVERDVVYSYQLSVKSSGNP